MLISSGKKCLPSRGRPARTCSTLMPVRAVCSAKRISRYGPFFVTDYLLTLSERFNKYYHNYRILTDDAAVREARLWLVKGVQSVIVSGLTMLGIKAPEEM